MTITRKVSVFPEGVPSEHYGVIQNIDFMVLKTLAYIYPTPFPMSEIPKRS